MRTLVVAILTAVSLAPARAQTPQFHILTAAEAAAINARRPSDWSPHHLAAGDVFVIDRDGIHIPTIAANYGSYVIIEDLEPPVHASALP